MGLFQGCHLLISLIFLSDPKVRDKRQPEKKEYKECTPEDIYAYFPLSPGVI